MTDNFLKDFVPLKIPVLGVRLPQILITEEIKKKLGIKADNNDEFLRQLCLLGFKNLKLKKQDPNYKLYADRAKYELETIKDLGFTDYILLVWDVINYCVDNSIPTGAGRGSAAGSLVLFLIGVTKIDPIKYGLYFERFISKVRAKKTVVDGITRIDGTLAPDIDNDICFYKRDKVIEYINNKYKGKTCNILTFNTLSGKLLIKEMGKIIGMKPEEEMTNVSGMIPKVHGVVEDLDKAYEQVPEFKKWCDENKTVYESALKLKDLIKNKSCHPSGILISYEDLDDSCPVELSSDKQLISGYDMNQVSLFSLKLDVLGLRGVSVIDDVCRSLKIKISDIDVHHPSIYQSLQNLKSPHGLFQIESDMSFKTTQKIKPKNLKELSAVLAIARPGAYQFIDQFANYSNNGVSDSVHPFFDDVLKDTGGLCLYQEQLLKMTNKVGFDLDSCEILRRVIGKKKVDEMKLWEDKIKDKIKEKGLVPEIGEVLWRIANDSSGYQFNLSHSVAYATLTACTVYLKFNHPQEFYLSLLKMTVNEPDPIAEISKIHKEMANFGIELLPPSLTHSKMDFSIEGKNIRFGLGSIKGIGEKVLEKLNNFKREHANKFELFQCAKEAGLSVGHVAAMTQAGCLSHFGSNRYFMVYECQLFSILTPKEKKAALDLGKEFAYNLPAIVKVLLDKKDEKGKPIIKPSRFETIKKRTVKYKAIYEQNKISQDFANNFYENLLCGFVFSKKLKEIYKDKIPRAKYISEIIDSKDGTLVEFVGKVMENGKSGTSKSASKSKYYKYEIEDETGHIKTMIFNDALEACRALHSDKLPKEGDVVIVKGVKKGDDCIFANMISRQLNTIFTKLIDIKEEPEEKKST